MHIFGVSPTFGCLRRSGRSGARGVCDATGGGFLLVVVLLSGCTAIDSPPSTTASATRPSTSAVASPSPAPPTAPSPVPPTSPAGSATATSAPAGSGDPAALRNLVLTQPVRDQLVRAYVTDEHYQPEWITGTQPGVYYAYSPATDTYFAWAGFRPAPGAPLKVLVGMQDGGSTTSLHKLPGAPWQIYDICTTPEFLAFVGGVLPAGGHC